MAKKTKSKCCVCGAPVGPGIRVCSHHCKFTLLADQALAAHKAKVLEAKARETAKKKKDKE